MISSREAVEARLPRRALDQFERIYYALVAGFDVFGNLIGFFAVRERPILPPDRSRQWGWPENVPAAEDTTISSEAV